MAEKLTGPVLLIEGGISDSNLRYMCGFTAPDPVVYLKNGRRSFLVVSTLEAGRAGNEAMVTEVLTPQSLSVPKRHGRDVSYWSLALIRRERLKRVVVSPYFPVAAANLLRNNGITVSVAKGPLFPGRSVKNAIEVNHIRAAQKAAVAGMRGAIEIIRSSEVGPDGFLISGKRLLTSGEIRREIETTLLQYDCIALDTIVAGGRQGADPHERGHGPLKCGEPIVIDIFPRHRTTGYWGDITRTVVKGEASDGLLHMYRAVKTAQRAALSMIKAGETVENIHRAVMTVFNDRGYITDSGKPVPEGFIHGTGHGIGLDIHEEPSINLSREKLRAGHVVTVEPGLYYEDMGGIRIEDTVVVTRSGWRYLATFPKTFVL